MHPLTSSCRALPSPLWVQGCHSGVSEELWLLTHPALTQGHDSHTEKEAALLDCPPSTTAQPAKGPPSSTAEMSLRVWRRSQLTTASGREGNHTTAKRGFLGAGGLWASSSQQAACCPCHSTNPWAKAATPAPTASDRRKEAGVTWHLISLVSDLNRISWQNPEGSPTAQRADLYYIYLYGFILLNY